MAQITSSYGAKDIAGPGGPRTGPQAAGHVHRLHRSVRPAPPGLGGRRQLRRRGHGRAAHPHRRHPAGRRWLPGGRRRWRHPHRHQPGSTSSPASRSPSPCCTAAASSAATATRSPAGCTASACRSSTPSPSALVVEVDRDGKRHVMEFRDGGKPSGKLKVKGEAPRGRTGTTVTLLARPHGVRDHRVQRSHDPRAAADDGLPQQGPGDPLQGRATRARQQTVTYKYAGGIVDFVRHVNKTKDALFSKVGLLRRRRRRRRRSRWRSSGTPASTPTASTASPTASTRSRAACTKRASRLRSQR